MSTSALSRFFNDDSVEIPGIITTAFPGGKTYRFTSPDATTGLRLISLFDLAVMGVVGIDIGERAAALELDDGQEFDLMRSVMGATMDELITDGASLVQLQRLNQYLFIYFMRGKADADRSVAAYSGETSVPANRAARRGAKKLIPAKSATQPASRAGSTTGHRKAPKASKA